MGRHSPRRAVRDTGFWKEGDTWSVIGHPWSVNLGMRAGGRGSMGAEMEGLGGHSGKQGQGSPVRAGDTGAKT